MGGKIRHTKLKKLEHPYDLETKGNKFTVMITENGNLMVSTGRNIKIIPCSGRIILIGQDRKFDYDLDNKAKT